MAFSSVNRHKASTVFGSGRLGRLTLWLVAGLGLVAVSACAPIYRNHGYVPTDSDLEQVVVGEDTRESVAAKVGRPSASGLLNDVGWYYVQSRWKTFGTRAPEEIDRQVLAVTFAETGVVENIERFGLEQGRIIPLSRRVTESNIKGIGFLQQLFGNLGRIRAGDIVD